MRSLKYCIDKLEGKFSGSDVSQINTYADNYRKEGFTAGDANLGAVNDFISDLTNEYNNIAKQVEATQPKKKVQPLKAKAIEAKDHLSKAADAFSAINKILGEKGAVTIEGEVEAGKWKQIKPLLQKAFDEILAAGKSGSEFVAIAMKSLGATGKPYFEKFVKEELGKEVSDVADYAGGKEVRGSKADDDKGRPGRKRPEAVQEIKRGDEPKPVRGRPGTADDADVRGKVEGADLRGKQQKQQSDSAGSKIGKVDKKNVGRDAGNVSGFRSTDHTIKPGSLKREGSWRDASASNLDAIELLKKINKENRLATQKEQQVLSKYAGWGASELANNMFPGYSQTGKLKVSWGQGAWKPLIERLSKALTSEELATAAKSTQYAHYTNEPVINSIYNALEGMGFKGGRILEPGSGVGSFVGLLPQKMRKDSSYTGIEMDNISAGIAKLLYPNQNMVHGDFVKQILPANFFDAAIGNPPFSSTKVLGDPEYKKHRFSLHNFFFAKSMDRIRPGGLVSFITSRYSMDAKDDRARRHLSEKADFLGAIRLPETAFAQSAGTDVVTDVLFFQKREEGAKAAGKTWLGHKEVEIGDEKALINEYFADHPEMILGTNSLEGKMYGRSQYTVKPIEGTIESLFKAAAKNLPSNIYKKTKESTAATYNEQAVIERDFDPKNHKEGGIYISDAGHMMVVDFGSGVSINAVHPNLPKATISLLKSYVSLRDALKLSHKAQLEGGDWETALKALNKAYDSFVQKHGNVLAYTETERMKTNADGTTEKISYRKYKNEVAFRKDVESSLVSTLESISADGKISKSKVLLARTINKPTTPKIETIPDALAVSLNNIGKFDIPHVAKIAKRTEDEVISALGDLIYEDTSMAGHILADEYLSGNVVRKLAEARIAAKLNPAFERNVLALEKVQPVPLEPRHITVTPGATWVPIKHYNHFATEALGLPSNFVRYQPIDNSWKVSGAQGLRGATNEWSTEYRGANEILDSVLNNRTIRITETVRQGGVSKTVFLAEATAEVNEIAKNIRSRFNSWVWEESARAKDLLDIYNSKINVLQGREYDGSHLTLPGMSEHFKPYDHQKRIIWRILQSGNTYMAHAVGSGKTFAMIAAGMEMRRLGMINKPLYVVPKHMLGQFSQEFQELYPMANILVADEKSFHTENRKRFVAQATLNDPDAVILTHSSFGRIGVKKESLAPVRDETLAALRFSLSEMEEEDESRMKLKRMEKRIERAEQRFDDLAATGDDAIAFEEFGADYLFVDEAHYARKLDFATNRQIKGIDPQGSRTAIDLYIKTRWLESQHKGRSHTFASGTPVVNTMGELYSIQKFFDSGQMEEDGINHFDAWASMFGEPATSYEPNAAGVYEPVERFSKFVNLPELMARVRVFADVLTSSQLGTRVKRPKIKGGSPQIVVAPQNAEMEKYQDEVLVPRIQFSRAWTPSPGTPGNPDPIINIITDGRLASIDMRFVDKKAKNNPESKLNIYIDGIIETYFATEAMTFSKDYDSTDKSKVKGGSQICFYNSGFGAGVIKRRGFDSKAFLMERLKEAGIPEQTVGWIDDYKTAAQKQSLFKLVRSGEKRILLGSAKKMGTGVNVQNRLTSLHYLDAPWFPADIEQPDGRIVRQGNQNEEVEIKRYATKGSYDETLWKMVARKSQFIDQAWSGGKNMRSIEDISETSQYEMAAALASGDSRVVQLAVLKADVERLSLLEGAYDSSQKAMRVRKLMLERDIVSRKADIETMETVEPILPEHIGAEIDASIGKKKFKERKAFGAALIAKVQRLFLDPPDDYVKIGSISGVDINASPMGEQIKKIDLDITIKGFRDAIADTFMDVVQWSAADSVGLTKKITNTINGIRARLQQTERELASQEGELGRVAQKLDTPFAHANELSEKVAEAAILEQEIIEGGLAKEGEVTAAEPKAEGPVPAKDEIILYAYSGEAKTYVKVAADREISLIPVSETGKDWANTFYVHRALASDAVDWTATEKTSGLSGGSGNTKKEAIAALRDNLSPVSKERFDKMIADHLAARGEAPTFSKRKAVRSGELKASDLRPRIAEVVAKWENAPVVKVLQSQEELPAEIKTYISEGTIVDGVYFRDNVYIIADNNASTEAAVKTLLHEAFGHYGIRGSLGKEFASIMEEVYISKKVEIDKIAEEYDFDVKTKKGRVLAAEEWIAREAVNNPESGWARRVIEAIRKFAKRIMPSLTLSDADIKSLLDTAREFVSEKDPMAARKIENGIEARFKVKKASVERGNRVKIKDSFKNKSLRGSAGTVKRRYSADTWEVAIPKAEGSFIVGDKHLEIIGSTLLPALTVAENKKRIEKFIEKNPNREIIPTDEGDTFLRVIWGKVPEAIDLNDLDVVSLEPVGDELRAIHVTEEPIFWAKKLEEDYSLSGRKTTIEVSTMGGDILTDDPQYALPEDSGYKADSHILVTGRRILRKGKDFIVQGKEWEEFPEAMFKKKAAVVEKIDTSNFLPKEVEKQIAESKLPKETWKEKLSETVTKAKAQRHHRPGLQTIEDEELRARVADILRRHQEVPEVAKNKTLQMIQSFTEGLSKDGYRVYRMNIFLADMMRDIKNKLTYDGHLPFGFKTTQDVETAFNKFQEAAKAHPEIEAALKKRKDEVNKLKKRCVDAKLLKKEVMDEDDYFHHQIIKYWQTKAGMPTGSKDVRSHWRPWMAARKGSMLNYNTDYLEAEYSAISQQLEQVLTVETLSRLKKEADVYAELKKTARERNVESLWELLREKGLIKKNSKTGEEVDPLLPYKQTIAMSNAALAKMAKAGTLEYDSEWQEIVDNLASGNQPESGTSDKRWFDFLSYLINTNKEGANWAATVMKAIQEKNAFIKETLGDKFLTYDSIIPEGYTEWKPDQNKGWFWANVITDKILLQIQKGEVDPNDVEAKKLLAKGSELIWVIPEGLAKELDDFRGNPDPAFVGQVADRAMRAWKQYILLNPYSVVRYNLNNASGDVDAALAYDPKIVTKYAWRAFTDLRKWHKREKLDKNIQEEIDYTQASGAIQSGFSMQEVADVYNALSVDKRIMRILSDETPNWFTKKEWFGFKAIGTKYWDTVKRITALRENTLRLAAYRYFMDNKDRRIYAAAASRAEMDAITDDRERSAKLSRELFGDYGNISKTGEYLRKRIAPFWSWMEINAPRYVYLMRNTKYENRDVDSIKKQIAAVTAKKLVLSTTKMALRASMLMAAVALWNLTMFPDEEEELGESGRRQMHLIFGRREDGSIVTVRFQGALSDALSYFALEDWPSDMKDVMQGKRTVGEKLKEIPLSLLNRGVQAIRPEPKVLGEVISGKSFYPEITRPLPIRDRVEHVLRTFKLDKIYRAALERPSRGKTADAPREQQMVEHFLTDLKSLLFYSSDPGMLAYYDVRGMVFDWLAKAGDERRYGGRPTRKGNALYYYKQAMKFGDPKAAERYLRKYYELGGTRKSALQSIKHAHPLASLPKLKRNAFRLSLDAKQELRLQMALGWYSKTYG